MEIIIAMGIGALIGATVFPRRLKRANEACTLICTAVLIFSMGAMLGSRETFLEELAQIGVASLAFCLVPVALSTALVFALSKAFMGDITSRHAEDARRRAEAEGEGGGSGEAVMIAMSLIALVGGVAYGLSGLHAAAVDAVVQHSDVTLLALMLFVGVSVGGSRGLVSKLREYHVRAFIVPFGVVVGSVAGGFLCAPLFGMTLAEGGAVGAGMGWYSLAGVMITGAAGATAGSIAFLSNLLREMLSFFTIPWIARHLNYPTSIAPAGATSEDTTLPMLIRCTNAETVVLAVVNGLVCSALVPVLIAAFQPLMQA